MAAIEEVGRALGGIGSGRIGGRHSMVAARAGLRVEVTELKKLSKEFDVIRASTTALRKEMDALAESASKAGAAAGGVRAGTSGGTTAAGTPKPPSFASSFTSLVPAAGGGAAGAGGAAGGGGGLAGRFKGLMGGGGANALVAVALGQVAGSMMGGLDKRIDRGMDYASNVDRLNVILQQQTGMSQMQVMNQMRKPLANYRLGADGISSMLAFQSQYGVQATPQMAQSIAGIRALNGYTKTTSDVLQDQNALMAPQVANRMYNMLGVNAYTMGGGVNDPMKMRQQLVQTLGLTNASVMKGAKQQGSAVRAMMTDAGIPLEVQDEVLGYAQSNLQFQAKTGSKKMYDPSKKSDRRTMGIEENFATQQDETERLRGQREENFTRRQIDNMAALERSNQSLIKALGKVEDKLSALVGARTASRSWGGLLGRGLQIAGLGLLATGVGSSVGAGMIVAGGAMAGDPLETAGPSATSSAGTKGKSDSSADAAIKVPVGYGGKRQSLTEVKSRGDFKALKPQMQERLLSMFRENPNVGIGGGFRNSKDQEAMFRSRYRKTDKDTGIFWDGSYWEHVSGAAAAPPGRSMHEIGLAADLVGDLDWMNRNASRFGLKHFAGVNNEPWHVQPSELPNSRRDYEQGGAAWGTDGGFAADAKFSGKVHTTTGAPDEESPPGSGNIGGMSVRSYAGMSISEIIATMQADATGRLGSGGGGYVSGAKSGGKGGSIGNTPIATGSSATANSGTLPGTEVAKAAFGAGFRKADLIKMVAIAKRESRWNPRAYNGNTATGDKSYGLWQLNTLNSKKGGQMGDLVNSILGLPKGNTNFDALFDPNTNARVAHEFYARNGNTLRPWGGYKGVSDTHGADQYLAEATQAVKQAGLGDPMPSDRPSGSPTRSSMSVSHAPTYQITIAPNINFNGAPSSPDLRKIAQEVTAMMREEVRTLEMRGA